MKKSFFGHNYSRPDYGFFSCRDYRHEVGSLAKILELRLPPSNENGGKRVKGSYLSTKSNSISNPAITHYNCILCTRVISLDKKYVDKKGRCVALDYICQTPHDCQQDGRVSHHLCTPILSSKPETDDNQNEEEDFGE